MDPAYLVVLVLLAVPHGGPGLEETRVAWKGEDLELAELATRAGPAPVAAVRTWAEWAALEGYRFVLDDEARVLLVVSEGAPNSARELARIAATSKLVDEVLPAPERPTELDGEQERWMTEWAQHQAALERETVVLLQLENHDDHRSSLQHLSARFPYLRDWAARTMEHSGYLVEVPLVAAWIRTEGGDELYHPENELVNKLARLLVLRRFGKLPHWLEMSLAWHFEYEILGSLFAFPDALNMRFSADFFGWDDQLRNAFKKRRDDPLRVSEVASWKEGTLDKDATARAWGLTRFLIREHRSELPAVLDRLGAIFYAKGRVRRPTSIDPIPGFQPSAEDQNAVLTELCGDDVLLRASAAFRLPRKGRGR